MRKTPNTSEKERLIKLNDERRKEIDITPQRKRQLEGAVERVIEQYGETLKLLANE